MEKERKYLLEKEKSDDGGDVPLVFVHGYKGSHLVQRSTGKMAYFGLRHAFGISDVSLSLPLSWQRSPNGWKQEEDDLVPTEPLHSVSLFCGLVSIPIYGPFLDYASSLGRPFYSFAYDWRRSNVETIDKFESFLERVHRSHGGRRVQVVGHSMGGIISFAVMNRRPELFHSAVFAGTPFHPGRGLISDLHFGFNIGMNKSLLGPKVSASFPSCFSFFPTDPTKSFLYDEKGDRIEFDYFDAKAWERERLGVFSFDLESREREGFVEHLGHAFRDCLRVREMLVHDPGVTYPPIAVITSKAHPVKGRIVRTDERGHVRGYTYPDEPTTQGDGTVPAHIMMPYEGVPYENFETKSDHMSLLNDLPLVDRVLSKLLRL